MWPWWRAALPTNTRCVRPRPPNRTTCRTARPLLPSRCPQPVLGLDRCLECGPWGAARGRTPSTRHEPLTRCHAGHAGGVVGVMQEAWVAPTASPSIAGRLPSTAPSDRSIPAMWPVLQRVLHYVLVLGPPSHAAPLMPTTCHIAHRSQLGHASICPWRASHGTQHLKPRPYRSTNPASVAPTHRRTEGQPTSLLRVVRVA